MDKNEFLDILRSQLSGQMPEGQINTHIQYYRNYIEERTQSGNSESEVMRELGDPRLIARTLLDTGDLLKIEKGALYQAEILGIQKGSNGSPGELAGLIRYDPDRVIGTIQKNTENGIYGEFTGLADKIAMTKMTVAYKQELETGPAKILCCVDGSVSAYDAEIVKIDLNHEDTNKSFVIRVIDPDLLEKTGGIVQ